LTRPIAPTFMQRASLSPMGERAGVRGAVTCPGLPA